MSKLLVLGVFIMVYWITGSDTAAYWIAGITILFLALNRYLNRISDK